MLYSLNFDSDEYFVSEQFPDIAARMERPDHIHTKFKFASTRIYEPLREILECPIIHKSGYRNLELNNAIPKAHPRSHHMEGYAVDSTWKNIERWMNEAYEILRTIPAIEYILIYPESKFWHIGFPLRWPRKRFVKIME